MKFNNIFKYLVPILLSSSVFAQDFYSYELFDNKFQAIFPGKPSLESISDNLLDPKRIEGSIPSEYRKKLSPKQLQKVVAAAIQNIKESRTYYYNDSNNNLSFISQVRASGLSESNYKYSGIKKILDKQVLTGLILTGLNSFGDTKLIKSSSTYSRKESTHIALYTFSFFTDGVKMYGSTKHIYHKDHAYKWSVFYYKLSDKSIFDNYQEHVKVLK